MLSLPAFALPRSRSAHPQGATRAFTLIELLMVIALIGVLAAITLSVVRGVKERASMGQAKTELAVLATALESYKRQYGDYPQTAARGSALTRNAASESDGGVVLLNALSGAKAGRAFIDIARFTVEEPTDPNEPPSLLDPWGQRYVYNYKTPGWKAPGYVLYSVGPDGTKVAEDESLDESECHTPPELEGRVDYVTDVNVDNIYANR